MELPIRFRNAETISKYCEAVGLAAWEVDPEDVILIRINSDLGTPSLLAS